MFNDIYIGQNRPNPVPTGYVASSATDLIDTETLVPALSIVKENPSDDKITRLVCANGYWTYVDPEEVCAWGVRHGYVFAARSSLAPEWIDYINCRNAVNRNLERMAEIEKALSIEGDSIPLQKLQLRLERKKTTREPMPRQFESAADVQIDQLSQTVEKLTKEKRKVTLERNKYLRYLQRSLTPTALEKLLSGRVSKGLRPKDNNKAKPVCFPQDDGLVIGRRVIGALDEPLGKDQILAQTKPVTIRSTSGVYFLINRANEIVYVGQAVNLIARIGTHCLEKNGLFSRVSAIAVPLHRLNQVETMYIRSLKPALNRSKNPEPNLDAPTRRVSERYGLNLGHDTTYIQPRIPSQHNRRELDQTSTP